MFHMFARMTHVTEQGGNWMEPDFETMICIDIYIYIIYTYIYIYIYLHIYIYSIYIYSKTQKDRTCTLYHQWVGLRENLQETTDVPMKNGIFLHFSLKPIS